MSPTAISASPGTQVVGEEPLDSERRIADLLFEVACPSRSRERIYVDLAIIPTSVIGACSSGQEGLRESRFVNRPGSSTAPNKAPKMFA